MGICGGADGDGSSRCGMGCGGVEGKVEGGRMWTRTWTEEVWGSEGVFYAEVECV